MAVITRDVHRAIVAYLDKHSCSKECMPSLRDRFKEVPQETLLSICSQHYQLMTKRFHSSYRSPDSMQRLYHQYRERNSEPSSSPDIIVKMAEENSLAPTLMARIVLEQYATNEKLMDGNQSLVSQWIKNPGSIPLLSLREQVKMCVLGDPNYGPLAENIKHSVGHEYELLLKEKISELKIPFLDEDELRERGYDKTPDVKLEVPIVVDGLLVSWIESKASFGDDITHNKYLEEQFWSYQNRFGPGLVLYWFGYVEELDCHRNNGIVLMNHFPPQTSIVTLDNLCSSSSLLNSGYQQVVPTF